MSGLLERLQDGHADLNGDDYWSAIYADIRDAAAELERLEAIVAKLPVTADGVPVVPGERFWAEVPEGRPRNEYLIIKSDPIGIDCPRFHRPAGSIAIIHEECYSTRKAAEEARETVPQ